MQFIFAATSTALALTQAPAATTPAGATTQASPAPSAQHHAQAQPQAQPQPQPTQPPLQDPYAPPAGTNAQPAPDASAHRGNAEISAHGTAKAPRARDKSPKPVLGPRATEAYFEEVNRYARGPNIGVEFGLWGTGMVNGLKTDIPWGKRVGQFLGTRLSFRYFTPLRYEGTFDPLLFATVEVFGRSPVLMGVVRLYGGGGVFFGGRPAPQNPGDAFGVTGGGHLGFEFFLTRKMSFTLELGGQGPMHVENYDAGLSVLGGVVFYFVRT
jgi:hypothetical protein